MCVCVCVCILHLWLLYTNMLDKGKNNIISNNWLGQSYMFNVAKIYDPRTQDVYLISSNHLWYYK